MTVPYLVECASPQDLGRAGDWIRARIETFGFCVLQAWDAETETLEAVVSRLGDPQSHVLADPRGLMGEGDSKDDSWKEFRAEYKGLTREELAPHTDGSFLDGIKIVGDEAVRVGPPKLLVLQCVRHAARGGQNILVDGRRILHDILLERPELGKVLLSAGCVTFCRDDQLALDLPVYQRRADGTFRLRFRYDFVTYGTAWSLAALHSLHHEYHLNERYRTEVDLAPGQILIVDNFRALHGRQAFELLPGEPGARKLRRMWVNEDEPIRLCNVEGRAKSTRALTPYEPYGRIEGSGRPAAARIPMRFGIDLPPESRAVAEELLRDLEPPRSEAPAAFPRAAAGGR